MIISCITCVTNNERASPVIYECMTWCLIDCRIWIGGDVLSNNWSRCGRKLTRPCISVRVIFSVSLYSSLSSRRCDYIPSSPHHLQLNTGCWIKMRLSNKWMASYKMFWHNHNTAHTSTNHSFQKTYTTLSPVSGDYHTKH